MTNEQSLSDMFKICLRSLQMCMHETYMDCPYYEQLMYVGDTRIQVLLTYMLSRDDRMPRKALKMFDYSRLNFSGLTTANHPAEKGQLIPPFSLWWIEMVHDYAMMRGDEDFVRSLMPGVRNVLDSFLQHRKPSGIIATPVEWWNFIDWADAFLGGSSEESRKEPTAPFNLQIVLALKKAAELEQWLDEKEMAARYGRLSGEIMDSVRNIYWDDKRKCLADDLKHRHFSEHSQCLAVISGMLDASDQRNVVNKLLHDKTLVQA